MRAEMRHRMGHVQGRHSLGLLMALALLAVAAGDVSAQMPVYKEGTKAITEPWPGDDRGRYGLQILMIDADSLRYLLAGSALKGLRVEASNQPNLLHATTNVGIAESDIPAKTLLKASQSVNVSDFSSIDIRVHWAAADSDSTALEVYVVGKESANVADGFDYLFDSNTQTYSGAAASAPAGNGANGWLCGPHAIQTTATYWDGAAILVPSTEAMSAGVGGGVTTNMVQFHVANTQGIEPRFRYVTVWVLNRTNTQIDDVTVDLFLKGR